MEELLYSTWNGTNDDLIIPISIIYCTYTDIGKNQQSVPVSIY